MDYYILPLYILFGILPSLIWLFYYLRKDLHPEPRKMIIKVFLFGFLITIPVFIVQVFLSLVLDKIQGFGIFTTLPILTEIIKWFLIISLTEEIFKYLAVKISVFKSAELDEPLDLMIYMIVSALGFAALENILYIFSPIENIISFNEIIQTTIIISFIRFIGATLLHALCSALLGYFLAIGFCQPKNRLKFTALGIFLATLLHGFYDFSIMTLDAPFGFLMPVAIIAGLVAFVTYAFEKVKKLKDTCQI